AAELSPENARVHYNYGLALQKLQRWDESERALRQSVRISGSGPQALDPLHALAILYGQQKRWDQAIACAEKLAEIEPLNPQWKELLQTLQGRQAAAR
ncbi:MAG: tetratricopeptide repeat protein, partial [Thermoguttaceae bacterium]